MGLLGPDGRPIETFTKANPPKLGPAFGAWAGRDLVITQLPGGAVLQFDLNNLTLADFRAMRDHPQINASLAVLAFMMHQLDWWIDCEQKKIRDFVEEALTNVWTRLIRAMSQSYWAGFSPIAIEYENDEQASKVVISKFKDLLPEECHVNWKEVEGYAPPNHAKPKFKIYDGIKQWGQPSPIPVENSLWYPCLMENGNYYGKKLLRPAFAPWYYSILVHLWANRYYERFGEPIPLGRAPFDEEVTQEDGTVVSGRDVMSLILTSLRNRSVVVLPNDRMPVGNTTEYEYQVEYLESQMRGADFERYLSRLDEEMSLGIFTPVLLFRTADVGSYNLGVGHMQLFMWMLNALAGDLKEYIDKYVVTRLKEYNYGVNAPKVEWNFRKMGKENVETVRAVLTELVRQGMAKPDLNELGQIAGMSIDAIKQVTAPPVDPNAPPADPNAPPAPGGGPAPKGENRPARTRPSTRPGNKPRGTGQPRATTKAISARIKTQVEKAWREKTFGKDFKPTLGYRRRFEESLKAEGASAGSALAIAEDFYTRVQAWMDDVIGLGMGEYSGPDDFMAMFDRLLDTEVEELCG